MLTPSQVRAAIAAQFPPDATCWSRATDEVRDMARWARETLNLGEEYAANFRAFTTPSQWNRAGTDAIVRFYERMSEAQRVKFVNRVNASFSLNGKGLFERAVS